MTRQPAINVGILLFMTFQAHPHLPFLGRKPLKVFYRAVAFPAGNFAVDMPLMIEQHVFGHIIDFYPGRWCIGVKVFVFLLDPGMVGNNIFMAVQAFSHGRYSGMIGIGDEGVAVLALDLFNTAVDIMAEWDRLFRSDTGLRRGIEKENKCRNKQSGPQGC